MLSKFIFACAALACVVNTFASAGALDSSFLSDGDKARLKKIVELKEPLASNELSAIYYYVHVNSLLEKTALPEAAKICSHVQAQAGDDLESIYFIAATAKLLPSCSVDGNKFVAKLNAAQTADAPVLNLFRVGAALANLGKPIDSAKLSKLLTAAVKKDDTLLNTGLAFQLAAKFGKAEDRNVFVDKIGDIIVQADEVNERLLQFEGGLGVSASIVNGIYQLATAANKPIGITNDKALKFVNYFLSRKYVLTPKGASEVVESLSLFTTNKFHIPLIVSKYGSSALSAEHPILTLKVTNVLGLPVGPVSVSGVSLTKDGEKSPALQSVAFKPVTGDSTLFAHDFFEKPLPSGFYTLLVNANPQKADPRYFGHSQVAIKTSILTQIDIANAELSIADNDVGSKSTKLNYPSTHSGAIEVDYSQRIQLKFQLKDRLNGNSVQVHQAFVRFFNTKTKQEIIFIAEQDSAGAYKVDLNLQVRAKDFNNLSGAYQVYLIVGDALVMNSVNWNLATVNIQFSSHVAPAQSTPSEYAPLPEIKHIFREPEKRPHPLVSNVFTVLVIVPFVALLIMWAKIGINFSGYRFSLSSILFHTSLALIFLLYGCFFVKLDMFQTIKYLAAFGALAYLSGHSLLSSLINRGNK